MAKIDIDYVKKIFKYVEENESINAPYEIKHITEYDDVKKGLGPFLDTICYLADQSDIHEILGVGDYSEDNFHYFIGFEGKILEIGMHFDYDVVYVREATKYNEEDIVDCNNITKLNETKKLVLKPNNVTKKEDK